MRITSLTPDSRYFIFFLRKSSAFSTAFSFTFSFTESLLAVVAESSPSFFPISLIALSVTASTA